MRLTVCPPIWTKPAKMPFIAQNQPTGPPIVLYRPLRCAYHPKSVQNAARHRKIGRFDRSSAKIDRLSFSSPKIDRPLFQNQTPAA